MLHWAAAAFERGSASKIPPEPWSPSDKQKLLSAALPREFNHPLKFASAGCLGILAFFQKSQFYYVV
jgi:hypothetical protein